MSNIRLTSNEKQSGKVVYNADIIQNIVELAVAEVEGALPIKGKKSSVALRIEKDGVYAEVAVAVKYGFNVPELAYRIQQSVKQSVENMTRYRVAEVDVHIQDVVFENGVSVEKTEEKVVEEETTDATNKNKNN